MRSSRKIINYFLLFVIIAGTSEGFSYVAGKYLQSKGVFYVSRIIEDYSGYLARRDPVLGWPAPDSYGTGDLDSSGSRIIPAFPDPDTPACVSLYGDSFTWSGEVENEYAWSNILSQLLNCRVANYGVGVYGSDQAYLRFQHNTRDKAHIVILAHLSENILRNVNQFRDLLSTSGGPGFKPRFILDEQGKLQHIPLPEFSEDEYHKVVYHPEKYLPYDYFVPGSPAHIHRFRFPFTFSVLRAFFNFHIQAELAGKPWYADFYHPTHPAQGLKVTAEILRAFENDAHRKGKIPLVLLIPTGGDLVYYQKHRIWVYQPLIDMLQQSGVTPLNVGEDMIEQIGPGDPCRLFDNCSAHYNEEGYDMLAHIVYRHLQQDP